MVFLISRRLHRNRVHTYITLVPTNVLFMSISYSRAMIHFHSPQTYHNLYLSRCSANNGPPRANQSQGQILNSKTHVISISTDKNHSQLCSG